MNGIFFEENSTRLKLVVKSFNLVEWMFFFVTQSKSKTQQQEVYTVSSIVLLFSLIGHNMIFICFIHLCQSLNFIVVRHCHFMGGIPRGLRSQMPFPGNRIFPRKIWEISHPKHSGISSSRSRLSPAIPNWPFPVVPSQSRK